MATGLLVSAVDFPGDQPSGKLKKQRSWAQWRLSTRYLHKSRLRRVKYQEIMEWWRHREKRFVLRSWSECPRRSDKALEFPGSWGQAWGQAWKWL